MAFVTFILMTGFSLGQQKDFSSDKLTYIFSKTLFLWIFEATVLKGFFVCLNFGQPSWFDLVAYTGYKFVILVLVMLAHVAGGLMVSYGVMVGSGALFCWFYYCTMRRI